MRRPSQSLGSRLGSPSYGYRWHLVPPLAVEMARKSAMSSTMNPTGNGPLGRGSQHCGDDQQEKLIRLEAAMFLSREPISTRKLAKLAKLADGTEARTLLKVLSSRYDQRASALQVVDVAGGVQLLTRPHLADWIGRLHGGNEEMRLSAPAMETLAVVAFRQPVIRAEIEAIRGVQCGEILRVLMERDLLRIVGRSEELGRPFLYGTTKKFLQVFGLRRLEQLPPIDQIHSVGAEL
jgi:segregation and condensation protein B